MEKKDIVTVTEEELKRFINTSIHFDCVKLEDNLFTVNISAKAEDIIEVVILPRVLSRAGKGGVCGGVWGFLKGGCVGTVIGTVIGAVGLIGCPIASTIGAGACASVGTVLGAGGGAAIGAAFDFALNKDSCTVEEIFPLLATNGLEKQGSDGRVTCTVNFQ